MVELLPSHWYKQEPRTTAFKAVAWVLLFLTFLQANYPLVTWAALVAAPETVERYYPQTSQVIYPKDFSLGVWQNAIAATATSTLYETADWSSFNSSNSAALTLTASDVIGDVSAPTTSEAEIIEAPSSESGSRISTSVPGTDQSETNESTVEHDSLNRDTLSSVPGEQGTAMPAQIDDNDNTSAEEKASAISAQAAEVELTVLPVSGDAQGAEVVQGSFVSALTGQQGSVSDFLQSGTGMLQNGRTAVPGVLSTASPVAQPLASNEENPSVHITEDDANSSEPVTAPAPTPTPSPAEQTITSEEPEVLAPVTIEYDTILEDLKQLTDATAVPHIEQSGTSTSLTALPALEYSVFLPEHGTSSVGSALPLTKLELKLSLAAAAVPGSQLSIEYQNGTSSWVSVATANLSGGITNQSNGGYVAIELPSQLFELLSSSTMRFTYRVPEGTMSDAPVLYLNSVWIEAHSAPAEQPQDTAPARFLKPVDPESFSHIDFENKFQKLFLPGSLEHPLTLGSKLRVSQPLLQMRIVGASTSTSPSRSGEELTYPDVFPSTDFSYRFSDTGLKELIHLKDINHPADFQYLLNLDEFDVTRAAPNRIDVYEKGYNGDWRHQLYTIAAPVMTDAHGATSSAISFELADGLLTLVPDAGWLKDAAYPVTVDPSVEISVLNVYSHPIEGDFWNIDFTTLGQGGLTITPADQATVDDMRFSRLLCGATDVTDQAQIDPVTHVVTYENWSCDDVAQVSFLDLHTGDHYMVFNFGGATADAYNAALKWTGAAGDGLWSNAGNWSPAQVPTSADSVTFDNTCTNCDVTIDANASLGSFTATSTYAGTITQAAGKSLTLSGAFTMASGIFNGGNATTTYGGNFTLTGGTYVAASTTWFTGGNSTINVPTTTTFESLYINKTQTQTIASGDTLVVTGTLTLVSGNVSGGAIDARGNIVQNSSSGGGNTILDFGNDSLAQTYTINGGTGLALRFDSTADSNDSIVMNAAGKVASLSLTSGFSGTLGITNPDAYTLTVGVGGTVYTQAAGTFQGGPWTVAYDGNFTITGGTYTAASTTQFIGGNSTIDVPGSVTFENLLFNKTQTQTIAAGDTVITTGTFTMTAGNVSGGTITAMGNVVQNSSSGGGNTVLDFGNDSVAQTYTINGGTGPALRLDSAADANDTIVMGAGGTLYSLSLTSGFSGTMGISNPSSYTLTLNGSSTGFSQAAGTFQGGPWTMAIAGNFTITGGTFNAASTTQLIGGNSTVNVPGSVTFQNLQINKTQTQTIAAGDTAIVNGTLTLTAGNMSGGTITAMGNVVQNSSSGGGTTPLDFGNDSVSQTYTVNGGTGLLLRFDSPDDASDSIVLGGNGTITGVTSTPTFAGAITVTNLSNYTFTVGSSGWQQAAGTFNPGTTNFTDTGAFTLSGGAFTGGSATTTFGSNFTITGGTFTAASTTAFSGPCGGTYTVPSSQDFNDVVLNHNYCGFDNNLTIASGTLAVNGTLTMIDGHFDTGNVIANGNVIQNANSDTGTAILDFGNDSVSQTYTINGGSGPKIRYDAGADQDDVIVMNATGSIHSLILASTFTGTTTISNAGSYPLILMYDYSQAGGTFQGGNWNFVISYNFTITGGTFLAPSTTSFSGPNYGIYNVPTSQAFNDVVLNRSASGFDNNINLSAKSLVVNGTLTVTDGRFIGGTVDAHGDVTFNAGADASSAQYTFTGSGNQTLNLTTATDKIDGNVTVNKSGGSLNLVSAMVLNGSSQSFTIATGTFDLNGNNLTVNGTSGTMIVNSSGTLKLIGNETVVTNNGNPQLQSGSTVEYYGTTTALTVNSFTYGNLLISGSGSFAPASSTLTVRGNFTQTAGTFTASSTTNVAGNFVHSAGTFNANGGTVVLNGSNQQVSGTTTFYNLSKTVSGADTLTIQAGSLQTVAGVLTLQGASSGKLSLRSSASGTQWLIDPQSTRTISYLDVQDSNNVNATQLNAAGTNTLNSGNNTNWNFDSSFTQSDYRWYQNNDALQPASALALQNTDITLVATSSPIRLRMNVTPTGTDWATSTLSFKLQVATSTSGSWLNVGLPAGWWDGSWQNRRKITFNNASSTTDLVNFPVLVTLSSALGNIDYSKTKAGGADIRFTDSSGNLLSYEIEKWDATATSTVWVKVPLIHATSITDYIYLYYNNPSATDAQTATSVWDSSYTSVWHLVQSSGSLLDSTANGNTATNQGSAAQGASGEAGNGVYLNGSSAYLSTAQSYNSPATFTLDLWFSATTTTGGKLIGFGNAQTGSSSSYDRNVYMDNSGHLIFGVWTGSPTVITSASTYNDGRWHHVVATIGTGGMVLYVDGASVGTNANTSSQAYTGYWKIGYDNTGSWPSTPSSYYFKGYIDEVRVSTGTRSSNYLVAEYKTGSNQFNTYASEENVGSSAWSFYDSPSVTSSTTISSVLLSTSNVQGTYQEGNPSALNPFAVAAGQYVEYDWALNPANAVANTTYYFRMVRSDGTVLDTYSNYPTLTTPSATISSTINISGTTNETSGTVAVAINGVLQAQTGTLLGGSWSISGVTANPGDVITMWIDGVADADESTAVTKAAGADITGLTLNRHVLTVGGSANPTISVSDLALYDYNDDEDIMHTSNGGAFLVDGGNSYSDETLSIATSSTLTLSGTSTLTAFNVNLAGNLLATTSGSLTINGTYTQTNGTFTGGSGMLTYNSNFTLSGGAYSGGSGTTTYVKNLTISGGTYNAASTTVAGGDGWSSSNYWDVNTSQSFNNLTFDFTTACCGNGTYIAANDTIVVNGLLTLNKGVIGSQNGSNLGMVSARGDIVQSSGFAGGNTYLDFGNDSVSQTYTVNGGTGPILRLDSAADASDTVVMNAVGGFQGVSITSGFSGIVPFFNASNYALTVSGSGWTQAAGTFNQGATPMTFNGTQTLSGGIWNGGTSTTTYTSNLTISGGTYNAASTTVAGGNGGYSSNYWDVNTSQSFHNLTFDFTTGCCGNGTYIAANDTIVVNGLLNFNKGVVASQNGSSPGILSAKGNIVQASGATGGNAVVDFGNDSTSQTYTVNGGTGPIVRFDSTADASDSVVFNAVGGFQGVSITSGFSGIVPFFNASNYALTVSGSGWTQAAGIFNLGNAPIAFYGDFNLSGGAWNGGNNTATYSNSNLTISGGTYNAASTTLASGNGYNLTWNVATTQTFNNLTFNFTPNCCGNGFTISSGDTIVVTGTTTLVDGIVQTGTLNAQGNVVVQSAYDGGSSPLVFSGSTNQTFDETGAAYKYGGSITINKSGGTVKLLSDLLTAASNQSITIATGTLDLNGHNLSATGTSATLTVGAAGALKLLGSETITANTNYPSLASGSTVEYTGAAGPYTLKNYAYSNLTLSGAGSFVPASSTLNILGSFTQSAGTFTASSTTNVAGNFVHSGGTFNANSGTVVLNGSSQQVSGTTTFYNLTKTTSGTDTLTFGAGQTQTIANALTLQGSSSGKLSLRSTTPGTQWFIDPQSTRTISYLDVQDSNNINATQLNAAGTNTLNSGNNTNWNFDSSFTQADFRWYQNSDALQPASALALQNTGVTLTATSSPIRLRMNVTPTGADWATSTLSFKLQVATSTSGTWLDVGLPAGWWDGSWQNRRKITFNNASSTTDLVNFPVLVTLSSALGNIDYSKTKAGGADIRFTDSSGTLLPYEIEKWDTSATSTVWVKVPLIHATSTTDSIYLYYNNPSASDSQSATSVWDSSYVAVQHLKDIGVTTFDSTSQGNNGTKVSATAPSPTAGVIGDGQSFNGSNAYIANPAGFANFSSGITVDLWAYPTSVQNYARFIDFGNGSPSNNILLMRQSTTNNLAFNVFSGSSDGGQIAASNAISLNAWQHFVATMDASRNVLIYKNGQLVGYGTSTQAIQNVTRTSNYFGKSNWSFDPLYAGLMDEVRISSTTRSADYILAEYKTDTNQFNTYASEENASGSSAWSFADNPSVTSSTTISSVLLSTSNVQGTYQEGNPSALNPFAVASGQYLEYDWALDPTNAVMGQTYYFRMVRSDGTVLGAYTNYPSLTLTQNVAPTTPNSLGPISVTSGGWIATSTPSFTFNLSDPDSGNQVGYHIQISTTSDFSSLVVDYTSGLQNQGSATYTAASALADWNGYYWRVLAMDSSGATSSYAAANSGLIAFKIDTLAPTAGALTVTSTASSVISLSVSGATDAMSGLAASPYLFSNLTLGSSSAATSSASWLSQNLLSNTRYEYVVAVFDVAGNTATSAVAAVYTLASVPTGLAASAGQTSITLSWSANGNLAGTEYIAENVTATTTSGWVTATSATFSSLTCGTTYSFRVAARNGDGYLTAYSPSLNVTTAACSQDNNGSGGGSGGGGVPAPTPTPTPSPAVTPASTPTASPTPTPTPTPGNNGNGNGNGGSGNNGNGNNGNGGDKSSAPFSVILYAATSTVWSESLSNVSTGTWISFKAALSGKVSGNITYDLYCDADGSISASSKATKQKSWTKSKACRYAAEGLYTAKVVVSKGATTAEDTLLLAIGNPFNVAPQPTPTPDSTATASSTPSPTPETTDSNSGGDQTTTSTPGGIIDTIADHAEDLINQAGGAISGIGSVISESVQNINPGAMVQQISEATGKAVVTVKEAGDKAAEVVQETAKQTWKVVVEKAKTIETAGSIVTVTLAPVVLTMQYSASLGGLLVQVGSFADIWYALLSFINGILNALGLRRRRRYWGTVYDSVTKQPLDPVIVELVDARTGDVVEQCITDLYGRFGFLDRPGKYTISVRKSHYRFPSERVTGENDGMFASLYHGGLLETSDITVITRNIPMDPLAFDWNQKDKQRIVKFHPRLEAFVLGTLQVLFYTGFALVAVILLAHPSKLNGAMFGLYCLMAMLRRIIPSPRLWGKIVSGKRSTGGLYLELSPVGVPDLVINKAVTQDNGKFFLKVAPGEYTLCIKTVRGSNAVTLLEQRVKVGGQGVVNGTFELD